MGAMRRTILIVDDNPGIRALVSDYLGESGFETITATSGREALSLAEREKPDLIVLDIMMPDMDGYEFMSAFRRAHNTPILLITAKQEPVDKIIGLKLGADDYLTKPFRLVELMARIRLLLRRLYRDTEDVRHVEA